jgi:hypothetical protein
MTHAAGKPAAAGQACERQGFMERRTFVFIVCSPLPRVGKTLAARLAVEFFATDGGRVAAFDVNPGDFALAEQLSDRAAAADISDTRGQMALFDQLIAADGVAKVVDVGFRSFEQFFSVMAEIGFAAEAGHRGIIPAVLLVADADRRSAEAYAALLARFPRIPVVPVLNAGAADIRFRGEFSSRFAVTPLHIPFLSPAAKSMVAQFGFSPGISGGRSAHAANELQAWKRRVLLQLRELELRLLLEEIKPALQLRA